MTESARSTLLTGASTASGGSAAEPPRWHVLWTRSHCEHLVHDQLAAQGFDLFLPKMDAWLRVPGGRRLRSVPMFPGYLFLRHALDRSSTIEVHKARGLVAVLGEAWDRPAVVPDVEIESIRRVVETHAPVLPYPYLREGERVRITRGPLADLEGVLVRILENKGLLIVSVDLLGRSVAVEVDCTAAVPVGAGRTIERRRRLRPSPVCAA